MTKSFLLITSLILLSASICRAQSVYKFDMGTKDSPVWEGFIQITKDTIYTKERGYGWTEIAPLEVYITAYGTDLPNPDPLCADWVAPGTHWWDQNYNIEGKTEFNLDLPNGEYKVYLIMGEFLGASERYGALIKSWSVTAEGQKKLGCNIDKEKFLATYYRHLDDEYHRGQDIWEKYVLPRFKPYTFEVKVEDGQLNILFKNRPINMMIVYPVFQAKQVEQWIRKLELDRKKHFPFKIAKREGEDFRPLIMTDEEKEKRYIVYIPDYMDDIYPEDVPGPELKGKTIEIFATQGEYEPGVFCIYPVRDLKDCKCEVTDLISKNGHKIKKEDIDLRMVRYWEVPASGGISYVKPWFLVKRNSMNMEARINREYWLTVKVPEEAEGGEYEGSVIFKPENAPATELTLKVKVLPFQLKELKDRYYYLQYHFLGGHPTSNPKGIKARFKDMIEHGFNADLCPRFGIKIYIRQDGNVRVDFKKFEETLHRWAKEYNWKPKILITMNMGIKEVYRYLKHPVPRLRGAREKVVFSKQFDNLFKKVMRKVVEELRRHPDWPEVVFLYVTAEGGGTPETIEATRHLLKLAKEAGCTTYSVLTQMIAAEETPYLDVAGVHRCFVFERVIRRIKELKGDKARIWGYNMVGSRLEWGFLFWKSGFECLVIEGGMVAYGDPYNPYDDNYICWGHVWPSPDGIVPTLWWERAREGVDDYRYVNHLDSLIKQAKKSENPRAIHLANEAEQVIKEIMDKIVLNVDYYRNPEGRGGIWEKYNWPNSLYKKYRFKLAKEIMKLEEVLEN